MLWNCCFVPSFSCTVLYDRIVLYYVVHFTTLLTISCFTIHHAIEIVLLFNVLIMQCLNLCSDIECPEGPRSRTRSIWPKTSTITCYSGCQRPQKRRGSDSLVPRSNIRGIPETMLGRILMLMWSLVDPKYIGTLTMRASAQRHDVHGCVLPIPGLGCCLGTSFKLAY